MMLSRSCRRQAPLAVFIAVAFASINGASAQYVLRTFSAHPRQLLPPLTPLPPRARLLSYQALGDADVDGNRRRDGLRVGVHRLERDALALAAARALLGHQGHPQCVAPGGAAGRRQQARAQRAAIERAPPPPLCD